MADVKISELPAASALVAGDLFPAVQDDSGLVTRKATAAQIGAYVRGLAGSVRQVVTASTSTQTDITTDTMTDTGLSGTITPASASSRVLVLVTQPLSTGRDTDNAIAVTRLLRGSTPISGEYLSGFQADSSGATFIEHHETVTFAVLDSPSSAGAVTYKTQGRVLGAGLGAYVAYQRAGQPAYITLVEVA